jgi:hypothetical protein
MNNEQKKCRLRKLKINFYNQYLNVNFISGIKLRWLITTNYWLITTNKKPSHLRGLGFL